jgi:hypothetical protein
MREDHGTKERKHGREGDYTPTDAMIAALQWFALGNEGTKERRKGGREKRRKGGRKEGRTGVREERRNEGTKEGRK